MPRPKLLLTKEELDKQRRLNKARAKAMEKEVTRYLNNAVRTERTPMSGAGIIKADGIVYLPNDQGIALIECKLSSAISVHGPQVLFQSKWIPKLKSDVAAMRGLGARFGFFVIKWHTWRDKIVLLPLEYIPILEQVTNTRIVIEAKCITIRRKKDGMPIAGINLVRKKLLETVGGILETNNGALWVTTLEHIKELLSNVQDL